MSAHRKSAGIKNIEQFMQSEREKQKNKYLTLMPCKLTVNSRRVACEAELKKSYMTK